MQFEKLKKLVGNKPTFIKFTKEWAGRCHPLGWHRNAHENTLGTLLRFHDEK